MADGDSGIVTSSGARLNELDDSKETLKDYIERGKHEQSKKLRNLYGIGALIITIVQIAAINAYFVFDAIGFIPWLCVPFKPAEGVFKVFTFSVFAEVIALAFIVMRSLFPGEGGFWSAVLGLFGNKPE